jgi:hypothetical protein
MRLTTTEQGYGSAHQRLRRRWKRDVELGGVRCARCGFAIIPGEPWDLGHDDFDRSASTAGPEHSRLQPCDSQGR